MYYRPPLSIRADDRTEVDFGDDSSPVNVVLWGIQIAALGIGIVGVYCAAAYFSSQDFQEKNNSGERTTVPSHLEVIEK